LIDFVLRMGFCVPFVASPFKVRSVVEGEERFVRGANAHISNSRYGSPGVMLASGNRDIGTRHKPVFRSGIGDAAVPFR
jgi:hypothetical protein